jgi:hypothetical protein
LTAETFNPAPDGAKQHDPLRRESTASRVAKTTNEKGQNRTLQVTFSKKTKAKAHQKQAVTHTKTPQLWLNGRPVLKTAMKNFQPIFGSISIGSEGSKFRFNASYLLKPNKQPIIRDV